MQSEKTGVISAPLSLGIDISTQSITGVLIDPDQGSVVYEHSLSYVEDPRLYGYGIDHKDFIIPPRRRGEADQPPALFLAALEALFTDMLQAKVEMSRIAVVSISAQQHGHVYVNTHFETALSSLNDKTNFPPPPKKVQQASLHSLQQKLQGVFSYQTAPIWMTSDTEEEADFIRSSVGGREEVIQLTGSDSPLRFTGAVIRRVGRHYPEEYHSTVRILLLNTFLAAVLSGNSEAPTDYGNSCGTSLLNYRERRWDKGLINAAAEGLPGGPSELENKLPRLSEAYEAVGTLSAYFQHHYGFSKNCIVSAGSGDNPQTKVLIPDDLLSLGTSFVNMVATDGTQVDTKGYANAMYDGLDRPFMFGCRTNGALVWDQIRTLHNLKRKEYKAAEKALSKIPAGSTLLLWQPYRESFPVSPEIPPTRFDKDKSDLGHDYSGIIDSSLGIVYHFSSGFSGENKNTGGSLYVTGGPAESPEILRRIAGIWDREVIAIGKVGAALGAAAAGLKTMTARGYTLDVEKTIHGLLSIEKRVIPEPEYVKAYHGETGYLRRLIPSFQKRTQT